MTPNPTSIIDTLSGDLGSVLDASVVEHYRDLGSMTTYRVGGRARLFVNIESVDDLAALVSVSSQFTVPVAVLGRGSNLLVADDGFDGLVVHLGEGFASVELLDSARVRLGGAMSLPAAARQLCTAALTGFEWAVGVPGSLGGAIRMNAGGHGSDMAASVLSARVVNLRSGAIEDRGASDLAFGYRTSSVDAVDLVVAADLALEPGDPVQGEAALSEIVRWRRENQPGGQNAGSVFTNPPGDSAGRLIEESGLKGFRVGSAAVSEKHANFIQADPGGSARDILKLMEQIVERVAENTSITLVPETKLLGFFDDDKEAWT